MKKASIMEAEARKQQQILQAQATAEALQIIVDQVKNDPQAQTALQFLLTQQYLEMGKVIGSSDSSKVMFIDPNNILSTLNGISSIIDNDNQLTKFSAPIIKENKSS